MKMLSHQPNVFTLCGKLGVDFFSTSDLLFPNLKVRLSLKRDRVVFHMINDNPNVVLGLVDCSLYTHRIVLEDDYQKTRMDLLA